TGQILRSGPDYSPSGELFGSTAQNPPVPSSPAMLADFDEDGRADLVSVDVASHVRVTFNRANRLASDPAESLLEPGANRDAVDPKIDLVELQGRAGAFDFVGTGHPQGALVLTLLINQATPALASAAPQDPGGLLDRMDGSVSGAPGEGPRS